MPTVGITELKAHLGEYLRRPRLASASTSPSRGVEVAELTPPDPVRKVLWEMVANRRGRVERRYSRRFRR